MRPEQIVAAITRWQIERRFHSLTCGKNSGHRLLVPHREGDRVVMICLDCDYRQESIPEVVLKWHERTADPSA